MRSLEKQLPLAAFGLLTLVAAGITWAAYQQARTTTRALFGERLTRVSDQLVAALTPGIPVVVEMLERSAVHPAVIRSLSVGDSASRAAAHAVLEETFGGLQPSMVAGAWDLSGDLVVAVRADTVSWAIGPPLVDTTTTTPLVATADGIAHHGFVVPVRDGRRLVGYLQVRQRMVQGGTASGTALLEALLGESAHVLLGSPGGVWTDTRVLVESPPLDVLGAADAVSYARDGVRLLGVGRELPGTKIVVVVEVGEDASLATARSFLARMALLASLFVALATAAAWTLGHKITGPLKKLRSAAAALGAGEYGQRIPEAGHPEIVEVAQAFNSMSSELADHMGALQVSEERFRSLVTATAQIVWWTDPKGDFTEPVPSWQAFTGCSLAEMQGAGWTVALHPEDAANALRVWKEATEHRSLYETEFRLRRHDGEYRWFLARGVPIIEQDGSIREWVGTCTDITKRRETEEALHRKEIELQRSQRLDAVGRLAGGIAHDFNNLLTAIVAPTDLAEQALPPGHPVREDLKEIRSAALRAGDLTRKLLAFGRQQVMAPVILDLNEAVRSASQLLERVIGESVRLDIALASREPTVRVDQTHFEQIIVNLAVNARDAMPDGGRLTLETADVDLARDVVNEHPEVRPGRYVLVAVTDTGVGMDAETQRMIFEPFFTTKDHDKGTGLGLSTVYGIIRQSGGHILVYSEPGRGSSFKIYLPRVDPDDRQSPRAPVETMPATGGTETILLTEDAESILRLGVRVLTPLGYTVLAARSGAEALELAAQPGTKIDLLVSDVVMAGMNGVELWERLRSLHPKLPALFTSGWASEAVVKHGILDGKFPFLPKPFSAHQLAAKVREVLDGVGAP